MVERLTLVERLKEKREHHDNSQIPTNQGGFSLALYQPQENDIDVTINSINKFLSASSEQPFSSYLTNSEEKDDGGESLLSRDIYRREVYSYKLLRSEEAVQLAKIRDEGTDSEKKDATESLITANLRLVLSLSKYYQDRGVDEEDVIQMGNLGLMKAAEKFDWKKGIQFSTYATPWIKQSQKNGVAEEVNAIHVPREVACSNKKMKAAEEYLLMTTGEKPQAKAIAELTDLPIEQVENSPFLFDTVSGDEVVTSFGQSRFDFLSDNGELQEEMDAQLEREELLEKAFSVLNEREKTIVALYSGLASTHVGSFQEIGDKLGLSRDRVNRIYNSALEKMKERLLTEFDEKNISITQGENQ